MIPGSANALLLGSAAGGYEISRSLRFNSADSAYLSRTPASAGNRKTWTWSGWVKRSSLPTTATYQTLFASGDTSIGIYDADSTLYFYDSVYGGFLRVTSSKYRDPSAWYHIVCALDTTQATAANRVRFYINGVEISSYATSNDPTQNADLGINQALSHQLGAQTLYGRYLSGYLADIHFIDGQALDPTSFGEFDDNGIWQPKAYSGSYGTNGFHLDFSDNSTAAALGTDTSGNGNTWTVNNISVAAGAGNDSLVDTPTSYGTDTGAGGEVRGNYCTWNPLGGINGSGGTSVFSDGNLTVRLNGGNPYGLAAGTIATNNGKFYWEVNIDSSDATSKMVGIVLANADLSSTTSQTSATVMYKGFDGTIYNQAIGVAYGATWGVGDLIGVALNLDASEITFYKNGSSQGAVSIAAGNWMPAVMLDTTAGFRLLTTTANFGQRPFAYTAPSGFKALCTANLPEPTIADGSTAMDVALYTGNGTTQTISGLGFSPDLVWIKGRSSAQFNSLYDTIRGVNNRLFSNNTDAENTATTMTAFNADGFAVSTDGGAYTATNANSTTYVAWTWDAGSSTVTNTDGTITSQVRANASAGFSIVTYTGTNSASATVGHGLGVMPKLYIIKSRNVADNWGVFTTNILSSPSQQYLLLNTAAAAATAGQPMPTSTVLNVTSSFDNRARDYVAYCFAPVAGYSAFGSYTGNGSADGPFVYLGFRPAVVLVKMSSSTGNWTMLDYQREGYNVDNDPLYPNLSNAEGTTDLIDITSNGFKVRTTDASFNTNAGTYIYAAWSESPFALARAR